MNSSFPETYLGLGVLILTLVIMHLSVFLGQFQITKFARADNNTCLDWIGCPLKRGWQYLSASWLLAVFMVLMMVGFPLQAAVQRSFLNNGFESNWSNVTGDRYCWVDDATVPPWISSDSSASPFGGCSSFGAEGGSPIIELWV